MRTTSVYILFFLVLLGCQKDTVCISVKEMTRADFEINYGSVAEETQIDDLLETHPHLCVQSVLDDEYVAGVHCYLYFDNLRMITERYSLLVGRKHPSRTELGDKRLPNVSIDIFPKMNKEEALAAAKASLPELDKRCISIELALDNKNHYLNISEKDYHLVWIVRSIDGGFPMVKIDANTRSVISSDDGRRQ